MKEVYGSATDSGDKDRYSLTQEATFTARPGFNFYEQKGVHELSYTCRGLLKDWELTTDLSGLQNQDVSHWRPPQILGERGSGRSFWELTQTSAADGQDRRGERLVCALETVS